MDQDHLRYRVHVVALGLESAAVLSAAEVQDELAKLDGYTLLDDEIADLYSQDWLRFRKWLRYDGFASCAYVDRKGTRWWNEDLVEVWFEFGPVRGPQKRKDD